MERKKYIKLEDLEVYKLAMELSNLSWDIYSNLDYQTRKIMGDQFITAIDSVGANITEGYGRFHYLDRIKFFYNARASLYEYYKYWLELLKNREKINDEQYKKLKKLSNNLLIKLNNLINSTYNTKNKNVV
jgi:four helix bundle protein